MPISPLVGAALVSGASGLASSLFGSHESRRAEDRAFQRSLQMQNRQNAWNTSMWRATNEYNSPSNQVHMMEEAGLNPAMFQGQSFQPASELEASDASVSQNGEVGNLIAGAGQALGDAASRTIQALQTDFQIQKLRNDIKYQEMLNEDFGLQLQAKKMELFRAEDPHEVQEHFDENGNLDYTSTVYNDSPHNYYQRKMLDERDDRIDLFNARHRANMENEVYQASMPFLKKMPRAQYLNMMSELRERSLNNSLLGQEVEMMKKYGISKNDENGWTTLIRMALRNPDAFGNIVDGLGNAVRSTFEHGVDYIKGRSSHRNHDW